jgi:hypothetical protein
MRPMAADLYDRDFVTWAERQAKAIRRAAERVSISEPIDWENVAEEIESLGKEQAHKLSSAYRVLLHHLLKWRFQPKRRSRSWRLTIVEQRERIGELILANLGLTQKRDQLFASAYRSARKFAAAETGLALVTFPESPPFTLEQAEDEGFLPG